MDVPLCVMDIETTGLSWDFDRIVEIWIGRYEGGRKTEEFHSLVHPGCRIPEGATAIHRITNAMVRRAPRFRNIAPELVRFLGDDSVVTHTRFDMKFISSELKRAGMRPLSNFHIDTCALARRQFCFRRNYNRKRDKYETNTLANIVRELGLKDKPGHRAKSDGMATASVLFEMVEVFQREWVLSLGDLDNLQRSMRTPSAKEVEEATRMKQRRGIWRNPR